MARTSPEHSACPSLRLLRLPMYIDVKEFVKMVKVIKTIVTYDEQAVRTGWTSGPLWRKSESRRTELKDASQAASEAVNGALRW